VRTWLVDTGPLVAYLNTEDPAYSEVARVLGSFTGRLATTSAVVTEATYFLAEAPAGPRRLAELLSATEADVHDFSRRADLPLAVSLMERYADRPMDFADATLVLLAEGLDVRDVLTLDRRGFSTYRTRRGKPFRLVLDG